MTRSRSRLAGTLALLCLACRSSSDAQPEVTAQGAPPEVVVSTAPADPAPALVNTISWSTASEVQNLGFDVYRSETEEGTFVRLTKRPILGAGTSDEPHHYRYLDADIAPETVYYYYVESITINGVREKFTPTFRSPPKPAPVPPKPAPAPPAP